MLFCRRWVLWMKIVATVVLLWTHSAALAWAQAETAAEEESGKSYGVSYGLIFLCVILGLMLVLRPAGRAEEGKKKQSQ